MDLDTNLVRVLVSDSVSDSVWDSVPDSAPDLVSNLVSFRDDNSLGFGFGFDKDVLVPDLVPVLVLNWYRFWIWFCPMGFFSTGFGFGFDSDMDKVLDSVPVLKNWFCQPLQATLVTNT